MESSHERPSDLNHPTPYYCEICDASFTNEGALRAHQKLQHGEAPDPLELQVSWIPREPTSGLYSELPAQETPDGRDANRTRPRYDEPLRLDPTGPGGSKVDENLLPDEDLDPARRRTESEAPAPGTQKSGPARRLARGPSPRRRSENPPLA